MVVCKIPEAKCPAFKTGKNEQLQIKETIYRNTNQFVIWNKLF